MKIKALNNMPNIKIFIATHKEYNYPSDNCYIPMQVGKESSNISLEILGDNIGDNISLKNPYFCELTALYCIWKNNLISNIDYIGLVHYRRYFKGTESHVQIMGKRIASSCELLDVLDSNICIVPRKRNYYIETVYSQYNNSHFIKDLDLVTKIIQDDYPEYLKVYEKVIYGKKLYLYNMFVMHKIKFINYCEWLFDILFKLEKKIDISSYDKYQARVYGFIAERLFNVWLEFEKEKNFIHIIEWDVINLEGEKKFMKVINFLKRKVNSIK